MEEEEIRYRELDLKVLERERETSLKNTGRFDRRNFSKQEAKLLYTTRPTRGLRFWDFFDKLYEVGVLSYLSFTLCLSVLRCFGWVEA